MKEDPITGLKYFVCLVGIDVEGESIGRTCVHRVHEADFVVEDGWIALMVGGGGWGEEMSCREEFRVH